jgi:2',3'-cyclic-nucleotide 2'-phosphodiesterase (5'-nucleotidase family)
MEKKQTAVEWLYVKLSTSSSDELVGNINNWFEQAKKMEKEQIIDAIVQVMMKQLNICSESGIIQLVNNAEQYYNETYGGQDESK